MILVALWAAPASAQQLEECDTNLTQTAMNMCMADRYAAWDGLLNDIYQRVIPTLDAATEDSLRQAQRAWITYRDLACAMERDRYAGGSIAPTIFLDCLTRLTERRTRDLDLYLRP